MYIETKSMVGGGCRAAIHHLSVWLEVFGWMIGWGQDEFGWTDDGWKAEDQSR